MLTKGTTILLQQMKIIAFTQVIGKTPTNFNPIEFLVLSTSKLSTVYFRGTIELKNFHATAKGSMMQLTQLNQLKSKVGRQCWG